MALGHHLDIEQAGIASRAANSIVEIELICRALTGKLAQASQGDFYISGADLYRVIEIGKLTFFPDLDRTALSSLTANTNTLGVKTTVTKG